MQAQARWGELDALQKGYALAAGLLLLLLAPQALTLLVLAAERVVIGGLLAAEELLLAGLVRGGVLVSRFLGSSG
jgi:hypothetical protein